MDNTNKASCTCPCCEPEEEDVLKFTIKEINQILLDGIINVSYRFSQDGVPIQTNLVGAISLIPEKYRTSLRIITFFNESGKPEIWLFTGGSSDSFENLSYWIRIYRPSTLIHGGYSNTDYNND